MRRYAHISVFSSFPVELVDEIARYSGVRELMALCLVSKQTGNAATRLLYHTVVLENSRRALRCFKTLVAKQDVADCVRRIIIDFTIQHLFANFYELALNALKRTSRLTALDLSGVDPLVKLIIDIPFQHLHEIRVPCTPALTRLLLRHQHTLRAIVLQPPAFPDHVDTWIPHLSSVELPELVAFVGPCTVIPYVIPHSQVQFLTVCWDPGCERPEEITRHVALSKKEVLGMDNLVLGWNPTLLGMIGVYMPKMERLRIRNVCSFTTRDMIEAYLKFLEEGLKKFECLQTLAITLLFNPFEYRLSDLDNEHEIVERWGALMPTLKHCTLPSTTRWCRLEDKYWIPAVESKDEPHRDIKVRWFLRGLLIGMYPRSLSPLLDTELDALAQTADSEGLLFLYSPSDDEDEDEDELDPDTDGDGGEGEDEGEDESDWENDDEDPELEGVT